MAKKLFKTIKGPDTFYPETLTTAVKDLGTNKTLDIIIQELKQNAGSDAPLVVINAGESFETIILQVPSEKRIYGYLAVDVTKKSVSIYIGEDLDEDTWKNPLKWDPIITSGVLSQATSDLGYRIAELNSSMATQISDLLMVAYEALGKANDLQIKWPADKPTLLEEVDTKISDAIAGIPGGGGLGVPHTVVNSASPEDFLTAVNSVPAGDRKYGYLLIYKDIAENMFPVKFRIFSETDPQGNAMTVENDWTNETAWPYLVTSSEFINYQLTIPPQINGINTQLASVVDSVHYLEEAKIPHIKFSYNSEFEVKALEVPLADRRNGYLAIYNNPLGSFILFFYKFGIGHTDDLWKDLNNWSQVATGDTVSAAQQALQSNINSTNNSVSQLSYEVSNLNGTVQGHTSRLDNHDSQIEQLFNVAMPLKYQVTGLSDTVNGIPIKVLKTGEVFATIVEAIPVSSRKYNFLIFDQVQKKLLTYKGADLGDTNWKLASNWVEVIDQELLTAALSSINTSVSGLTTRVTAAEETISGHSNHLNGLQTQVNDLSNATYPLPSKVESLDTQVQSIQSQVDDRVMRSEFFQYVTPLGDSIKLVVLAEGVDFATAINQVSHTNRCYNYLVLDQTNKKLLTYKGEDPSDPIENHWTTLSNWVEIVDRTILDRVLSDFYNSTVYPIGTAASNAAYKVDTLETEITGKVNTLTQKVSTVENTVSTIETDINTATDQKISDLQTSTRHELQQAIAGIDVSGSGDSKIIYGSQETQVGIWTMGGIDIPMYERTFIADNYSLTQGSAGMTTLTLDSMPLGAGRFCAITSISYLGKDGNFLTFPKDFSFSPSIVITPNFTTSLRFGEMNAELLDKIKEISFKLLYAKIETTEVSFDVDLDLMTLPEGQVDPGDRVKFSIAPLKYNKKAAFSLVHKNTSSIARINKIFGEARNGNIMNSWSGAGLLNPLTGERYTQKIDTTVESNDGLSVVSARLDKYLDFTPQSTTGKTQEFEDTKYAWYRSTVAVSSDKFLPESQVDDITDPHMTVSEITDYLEDYGYDVIVDGLTNYTLGQGKVKFKEDWLVETAALQDRLGYKPNVFISPKDDTEQAEWCKELSSMIISRDGNTLYPGDDFDPNQSLNPRDTLVYSKPLPSHPDTMALTEGEFEVLDDIRNSLRENSSSPYAWTIAETETADFSNVALMGKIYELYGDRGADNLLVAGVQEIKDYWFLRRTTLLKYRKIGDSTYKVVLRVPTSFADLRHKELTILATAEDIDSKSTKSERITFTDQKIFGAHSLYYYTEKDGKTTGNYTFNIDLDEKLPIKAKKFYDKYIDSDYKTNLYIPLYFCDKLVPGTDKTTYMDALKAKAFFLITDVGINGVFSPFTASSRNVEVTYNEPGRPSVDSILISEDPTFKGARIRKGDTGYINSFDRKIQLSKKEGSERTLYIVPFSGRNKGSLYTLNISYNQIASAVYGVDSPKFTHDTTVPFIIDYEGAYDEYRITEGTAGAGDWKTGILPTSYTFVDTTPGIKSIFIEVKKTIDTPLVEEVINSYTHHIYLKGDSVPPPNEVVISTNVSGTWNRQSIGVDLIYPGPFVDLSYYRIAITEEELEEAVWQQVIEPVVETTDGVTTTKYSIYYSPNTPFIKGTTYKFFVQTRDSDHNESSVVQTSDSVTYYNPARLNRETFRVGDPGQVLLDNVDYPVHMDFLYGDPDEIKIMAGYPSPEPAYVPYVKGQTYTVKFINSYDQFVTIFSKVNTPLGEMPFYYERWQKQVRG